MQHFDLDVVRLHFEGGMRSPATMIAADVSLPIRGRRECGSRRPLDQRGSEMDRTELRQIYDGRIPPREFRQAPLHREVSIDEEIARVDGEIAQTRRLMRNLRIWWKRLTDPSPAQAAHYRQRRCSLLTDVENFRSMAAAMSAQKTRWRG